MKASGLTTLPTGRVSTHTAMAQGILALGSMINSMASAPRRGMTEPHTKVNITKVRKMVRESSYLLMGQSTREISKWTRSQALENTNGLMVKCIKEPGLKTR